MSRPVSVQISYDILGDLIRIRPDLLDRTRVTEALMDIFRTGKQHKNFNRIVTVEDGFAPDDVLDSVCVFGDSFVRVGDGEVVTPVCSQTVKE